MNSKEIKYNPYHRMVMRVIEGVLILRYDETIREEEGGTYGVGLRASLSRWPVEKASIQIRFDCAPERYVDLKRIVYEELMKLAKDGPSEENLSKTVENLLKDREESKEHNAYSGLYGRSRSRRGIYAGVSFAVPQPFPQVVLLSEIGNIVRRRSPE